LFGRDAPEAHTLVSEEHCRSSQEELPELQDRIKPPALEKQDATAKEANGSKENVVIAS
jgi:hypothetical protein